MRSAPASPAPSAPPRPWWQWAAALLTAGLAVPAGLGLLAGGVYVSTLDLPDLRDPAASAVPQATVLYAADGAHEIGRLYREHRLPVGIEHISPHVIDALIATEDHRFYRHPGIDVFRLAAAAVHTLLGDRQGGSTITMQLARNRHAQIAEAPLVKRKLLEILMALRLERRFSKKELLERYLNTVSFGQRAFGIEAAAHTYFGKPAARLGVLEAATLVGLLKATTYYDPVRHPRRARQRRNVVLRQMVRRGFVETAAYERLHTEPVTLDVQHTSAVSGPAPHFAMYVRRRVEDWAEAHGYDPYTDGLRVYTTLDGDLQQRALRAVRAQLPSLQAVAAYEWSRPTPRLLAEHPDPYVRRAEAGRFAPFAHLWKAEPEVLATRIRRTPRYRQAVRRGMAPGTALRRLRADTAFTASARHTLTRLQTGLVAIDPHTGAVRAWVGSRNFRTDAYDHVALARRQPGSTFKPFVYAAALAEGYAPADRLIGGRIRRSPTELLRAVHTADSLRTAGLSLRADSLRTAGLSLRAGLTYSSNAVALQLIREIGPQVVAQTAHRLGIRSPLRAVPSLALGTSEVTLLEMASAYATLAAGGIYREPVAIARIEDRAGRVLYEAEPAARKALSMYTAYTVVDMMRGVIDRGTGAALRRTFGLTADLAGKTGTTQNNADGWFMLIHPELVAGAWVGFNDRRVHFRTEHWGRGSSNALRVVGDFFRRALLLPTYRAAARFMPPPGYRTPSPRHAAGALPMDAAPMDAAQAAPLPPPSMPDAFAQGLRRTRRTAPAALGPLARQSADPGRALRRALGPVVSSDTARVRRPGDR